MSPEGIEHVAADVATRHGLKMTVLAGDQLRQAGLGLLAAVGQAARWPPRVVMLEYKGADNDTAPTMLVGKGITFDTGGLNLKPTGFIEDMHADMAGSATVLATMQAAAQLKLPVNIGTHTRTQPRHMSCIALTDVQCRAMACCM